MLVDHEYFFRLFRMSPSTFEILLSWVAPLGPVRMGRSYLGYRENISTSLLARSRLVMKITGKLHCVHTGRKVFPGTEISLADRRDLGDRESFCPI